MAYSVAMDQTAGDEPMWETVVSAVAEATGMDPLSMDPLYEAIDPDALNVLFAEDGMNRSPQRVTFTYCDCEVVVSGDGSVRVETSDRTGKTGGAV